MSFLSFLRIWGLAHYPKQLEDLPAYHAFLKDGKTVFNLLDALVDEDENLSHADYVRGYRMAYHFLLGRTWTKLERRLAQQTTSSRFLTEGEQSLCRLCLALPVPPGDEDDETPDLIFHAQRQLSRPHSNPTPRGDTHAR